MSGRMQCSKQGPTLWMDRGSCRGRVSNPRWRNRRGPSGGSVAIASTLFAARRRWIAFALTSRTILRGGQMTQRTSRERSLSRQGGFETRPYKSPDLCMRRAAALSPSAQALFDHFAAPA
jgi:hypothetical protein